jgi:hypothetical protein
MKPREPHFDPLHRQGDKTLEEWSIAGPNGWLVNATIYCLAHGESRVLLRAGNVIRLSFTNPGPIRAEELP